MGLIRIVITIALLLTLAVRGIQKQSLSYSGAVAAVLLGGVILSHPSMLFGSLLLTFYLSSSKLTKFKSEVKKQLEEGHLEGGQRNAVQVLSNGLTGLVACCLHWYWSSIAAGDASAQAEWSVWIQVMLFAYIGHFASCNGDTWASELGVLSTSDPILITTLRRVPRGTNGGISTIGTAASMAGGLLVGMAAAATLAVEAYLWNAATPAYITLMLVGVCAGFGGSMVDSLLGATLQKSVYNKHSKKITQDYRTLGAGEKPLDFEHISGIAVLDNHQINFVSSLVAAVMAGAVGYWLGSS